MSKIDPSKLVNGSTFTSSKISTGLIIPKKNLLVIKNQVIEVKNLLQTSTLLKQAELSKQKKQSEKERFQKKESDLEAKKVQPGTEKIKVPGLPQLGFLDRIKNFIFTVLLGRFIVKMLPQASKLADVVKGITTGIEFATDLTIGLIDGLSTFVDKGYKAYDATRGFLKTVGGDNTLKLFDGFTKAIDATIIAAIALTSMPDPFGLDKKKVEKPTATKPVGSRLERRLLIRTLGKTGAKNALKYIRPFTKRLPLIGAFLDFGLSVALGESPGRAAFKSIGALLGSTVLGAAGSVIPVVGNFAGAVAGGMLGDKLGGALYDMFFENKVPQQKTIKAAGGGTPPPTRGGKFVGGPARRIIKKPKRMVGGKVSTLKPGADVGGKNKIEKVFPEQDPKNKDKDKQVNPLGYIQSSYKKITSSKAFGGLMALPLKTLAGQKPTPLDYKVAAQGLNLWLNNIFSSDIERGGVPGFAGGGEVNTASFLGGEDMTNVIAKSLENSVSNQLNYAINDLMKQLMLKPREVEKKDITQPSLGEELGDATDAIGGARLLMAAGFPPLAAAVLASVIQAESSWQGQQEPWVLNDGGGTNKGLISWTSNSGRIQSAEKFLGKPLETASNAEQIRWIKEELRQYGLLDDMTNPQATEEQLKEAIYNYVRWDRKNDADHWKNITRIRTALERGEQGTYRPPTGNMPSPGSGNFVQGNSGYSKGIHFHIGPGTEPGQVDTRYNADARAAASKVVKHFLGKKSLTDGRRNDAPYTSGSDAEMMAAQRAHSATGSQGGIDIQVGGAYDPGAKVPFPFAVSNMAYRPGGFGVSARINGTNAFVAHGRYDERGRIAPQYNGNKYAFHGGPTGKGGLIMTHQGEYIIDKDSVDAFGMNFFDIINQTENMSQRKQAAKQLMGILQLYAGYEAGGRQKIKVKVPAPQVVTVPVPVPVGGPSVMSSNSSGSRPQDITYRG
jgi:hypothetical protein